MTGLFKRRIKVAPEVKISIGKSEVSNTFGIYGMQSNVKSEKIFLNTGVPGTGIYNIKKTSTGKFGISHNRLLKKYKSGNTKKHNPEWDHFGAISLILLILILIFGRFEHWILILVFGFPIISIIGALLYGKKNPWLRKKSYLNLMEGAQKQLKKPEDAPIKKAILKSYLACLKLSRKANEKENMIKALKNKFQKTSRVEYAESAKTLETQYKELEKQIDSVQFDADEGLTGEQKELFAKVVEKFESLINSEKRWQIILDKKPTNPLIREEVNFYLGLYAFIKSEFPIPVFTDSDNNFYYLYPKFLIKAFSPTKFEVFNLSAESFLGKEAQFVEKQKMPKDAKVLDKDYAFHTAEKSERIKLLLNEGNPIALYGELNFPQTNLNYLISNVVSATDFNGHLELYLQSL